MAHPFTMRAIHLHMKPISKGKGHDVANCLSYRLNKKFKLHGVLVDARKHIRKHEEVPILNYLPGYENDIQRFIDDCHRLNTRKNARFGREVEISIPNEFNLFHREEFVRQFMCYLRDELGMPAIAGIHEINDRGENSNPHVHIFIPDRIIKDGKLAGKNASHNKEETLLKIRKACADLANKIIREHYLNSNILTDKSYKERGIPLIATVKIGHRRHGEKKAEREYLNEKIREYNRSMLLEMKELLIIEAQIARLESKIKSQKNRERALKAKNFRNKHRQKHENSIEKSINEITQNSNNSQMDKDTNVPSTEVLENNNSYRSSDNGRGM